MNERLYKQALAFLREKQRYDCCYCGSRVWQLHRDCCAANLVSETTRYQYVTHETMLVMSCKSCGNSLLFDQSIVFGTREKKTFTNNVIPFKRGT